MSQVSYAAGASAHHFLFSKYHFDLGRSHMMVLFCSGWRYTASPAADGPVQILISEMPSIQHSLNSSNTCTKGKLLRAHHLKAKSTSLQYTPKRKTGRTVHRSRGHKRQTARHTHPNGKALLAIALPRASPSSASTPLTAAGIAVAAAAIPGADQRIRASP